MTASRLDGLDFGRARLVFVDTEFTGEHAATTLVSMGLVTLDGRELNLIYNDYAFDQVTDWLRENVLSSLDVGGARSAPENLKLLRAFLDRYVGEGQLFLVSAGLTFDVVLFLEQFKHGGYKGRFFHALHDTPPYISNASFVDLNTLIRSAGLVVPVDRGAFAGISGLRRHDALDDARAVRGCFLRLMQTPLGQQFAQSLRASS